MNEKKYKNSHLTKAQYYGDKNGNEFYTPYDIIAEEVQEISAFFDGKVVYNNCDDGARSNFYKYFKDDADGIYEVKYIKNLPIDYYGEVYCPTSILFMPYLRKQYEIIKKADKMITVNGKKRFYRVLVKRKPA